MHSNHMSIFDREARLIEPNFTTEDRPNCSNVRAIRGYRKTASLDFVLAVPTRNRHSSLPEKRTKSYLRIPSFSIIARYRLMSVLVK
jgi:hypothetical protein